MGQKKYQSGIDPRKSIIYDTGIVFDTDRIIRVAKRYMDARGIAGTTLCRIAIGSSTAWHRLPEGGVTVRTANRLMRYLSDHWPEHLEWPPDVPRPEPTPAEEGKAA